MNHSTGTLIVIISCVAVAVILFMGLWNMFKGGDGNRSQLLMRARIIAQAVALLVILGAFFFFGRSG